MAKKRSEEAKARNRELLLESSDRIQEELGKDMSYGELLASIIPVSYPNLFEKTPSKAELVTVKTSEGMRMGFSIPETDVLFITEPEVEENLLKFMVAFVSKSIVYTSGLEYALYYTGDLGVDCELWYNLICRHEKQISDILWMLSLDEDSNPIQ